MDPFIPILTTDQDPGAQSVDNYLLAGIFLDYNERDKYLASLDSDTRDYVLKHTDEFRTKADIINCVERLRQGS